MFDGQLFSAKIQKPMEKSYWVFVEGTWVMQTTALAYKNMSSLQHSINGFVLYLCIYVLMNTMSEAMAKTE